MLAKIPFPFARIHRAHTVQSWTRRSFRPSRSATGASCRSTRDAFLEASRRHAAVGEYRFVPTGASLQPAVAIYLRRPGDSAFRALALEVLRVQDCQIAEITDFPAHLFGAFGLPAAL
jgi:hypothetical protein